MDYLPELCDSGFEHQPFTHLNKHYYRIDERGHFLCDECLSSWIYWQGRRIAEEIFQHYQGADEFKYHLFGDPNNKFTYRDRVPMSKFMRDLLGSHFDVQTEIWSYSAIEVFDQPGGPSILGSSVISMGDNWSYTIRLNYYAYTEKSKALKYLIESVSAALRAFIRGMTDRVPDADIETEMRNLGKSKYESSATGASTGNCPCDVDKDSDGNEDQELVVCAKCGRETGRPYYIYRNQAYCLDDMYDLIVDQAVRSNLTEAVGLAEPDEDKSSNYRIVDTPEWKISVISKYFQVMDGFDRVIVMHQIN